MRVDKSKWEKVRLIDVAPICPSSENSANSVVWLLNLDMIESQTGKIIRKQYCDIEEVGSSVIQFTKSNVLWSKLRPYLNKVVLPDEDGYATSELIPLLPNRIEREYLAYLLMSKWFVAKMVASSEGARMPRASMKEFRKLMIALPSDNEQQAIAEELDDIQSMIGKCREQLEDYDRLARSIFHEMFGDPVKNNKGWEMKTLGDVCEEVSAGGDKPLGYTKERTADNTIPIYANGKDNDGLYGFCAEAKVNKHCLSISGRGTIGYAVIHREPFTPIVRLIVAIPKQDLLLEYFKAVLAWIEFESTGNTIPQLTVPLFKKHSIPLPPLPLQQQFATRIEAIEKMKEATKAQLADLQQLFDSRMQYYFS